MKPVDIQHNNRQVKEIIFEQVYYQVYNKVFDQVYYQVYDHVRAEVFYQTLISYRW
jgi:hypothetical protein